MKKTKRPASKQTGPKKATARKLTENDLKQAAGGAGKGRVRIMFTGSVANKVDTYLE